MKNHEISKTFGIHRGTLYNWEKNGDEGRELLLYLLRNIPKDYMEKVKESFRNEKEIKNRLNKV